MDHSSDVLMFACLMAAVAFTLWLLFRRYQVSTQVRMQKLESFNKLIEKFGNAKEFVDFAQTEQGKKMLGDQASPPSNPLTKVLRFIQAGVLFLMIGFADWINATRLRPATEPNYVHQMIESDYWGTIFIFIGLGLILAAGISYIFVRQWHLANGASQK